MKIAILTDAWYPHISGVTTTVDHTIRQLQRAGHQVCAIHPQRYSIQVACPTYPQIKLAVNPYGRLKRLLRQFQPEAIHIVTEGPIGLAGRYYCRKNRLNFTSAFTTRFDEYIEMRSGIPARSVFKLLRWFHSTAARVMIATVPLQHELARNGLSKMVQWPRGVDTNLFRPRPASNSNGRQPVLLYVGRVAVEKNIEAFLKLKVPGAKVVVGDGPARPMLARAYPGVKFVGAKRGAELAGYFASGDVFVFPSRTDTFGIVMLEAMACGVPVAAYPVRGPKELVRQGITGCLDEDLAQAVKNALGLDPDACRAFALKFSWENSTQQFIKNLVPV